jgi:hypothetical protein
MSQKYERLKTLLQELFQRFGAGRECSKGLQTIVV